MALVSMPRDFLLDLFLHQEEAVSEGKLAGYTETVMKIFDKNNDGRLDLNDLARILALQQNFLLQFKVDACSTEERRRDFEKIFAHYDVGMEVGMCHLEPLWPPKDPDLSRTRALEGPEADGFVKDMMELVRVTSQARRPAGTGAAISVDSTACSGDLGLHAGGTV